MRIFYALLLTLIFQAPHFADEIKIFQHAKTKFSVEYPTAWILAPEKEGIPFMASATDGTANVQVMIDTMKRKTTACEYLAKTEAAALDGRKNLIPEAKRRVGEPQLKFMGVKDGCIAAYKITTGGAEILQGTGVYTSGKKVWVLIQTLHTAARERHSKSVGDIAKSFKTQ